jgi:hypothetical protein
MSVYIYIAINVPDCCGDATVQAMYTMKLQSTKITSNEIKANQIEKNYNEQYDS